MRKQETVNIKDVNFLVDYDYYPPTPATFYDASGVGTPPSPGEIEIFSIHIGETNVTDLVIEYEKLFDTIETMLFEISDDDDWED